MKRMVLAPECQHRAVFFTVGWMAEKNNIPGAVMGAGGQAFGLYLVLHTLLL